MKVNKNSLVNKDLKFNGTEKKWVYFGKQFIFRDEQPSDHVIIFDVFSIFGFPSEWIFSSVELVNIFFLSFLAISLCCLTFSSDNPYVIMEQCLSNGEKVR